MKKVPVFKSEDEEIEFWDTHDSDDYVVGEPETLILDLRPERKKQITLRLEPSLIEELKRLAAAHDLPYQTLARGLLRRSVAQMGPGKQTRGSRER